MALHTLPCPPAPANPLPLHFPPKNVSSKAPVFIVLRKPVDNLGTLSLCVRVPAQGFQGCFRELICQCYFAIFGGLILLIFGCKKSKKSCIL